MKLPACRDAVRRGNNNLNYGSRVYATRMWSCYRRLRIEHEVYYSRYVNFCYAKFLHEFLTDPCWAWFDSVRNTERYQEAVAWAKVEAEKEEKNK